MNDAKSSRSDKQANSEGQGRRTPWHWAPFCLATLAALALAVHQWMPNRQTSEPTRIYSHLLELVIVFGLLLGATQRLWRAMDWSPPRRIPLAALSNFLNWCVRDSALLAAGVLLL